MPYLIWLAVVGVSGWVSGQIAGSRAFGKVADVLFGLTGAFLVRFTLEVLGVSLEPVYLLLLSMWGAAALPAIIRCVIRLKFTSKFGRAVSPSLR